VIVEMMEVLRYLLQSRIVNAEPDCIASGYMSPLEQELGKGRYLKSSALLGS
jgi:hypothetical protein